MKKSIVAICLCLFFSLTVSAAIRLPNILGSHMVLQQKSKVKLWGWGQPSEKIIITTTWNTDTIRAEVDGGAKWVTEIITPSAGGPYKITIAGSSVIVLDDVLIGETWVCGGQSNMEWSGDQQLQESIDEAPLAKNNKIRLFYVTKSTASFPQDNLEGKWVVCSPEEMIHFSAIGYFFGKNLQNALNTPIGLINSNWGGTAAETWTPTEVITASEYLTATAAKQNATPWWPHKIGDAYNAMIAPLTNYTIAGAIWYQGESNTGTYYGYTELFTKMIHAWRKNWNKNFPFYFVQIAPFHYGNKNVGALLREAQTKAAGFENTGMVVVSDLVPDTNNIHPTLKKEVAARLANLALDQTYKNASTKGINPNSPSLESFTIEANKIIIKLKDAPAGIMAKGDASTYFEIAGADKIFMPAQVKIEGGQIIVTSSKLAAPVAVRYGFSNTTRPNLYSKTGLPVNIFRTDNWEMDTSEIK